MRPKKYPYSGKLRIARKELPRLVKIGNAAFCQDFIESIREVRRENNYTTIIIYRVFKPFFNHEYKTLRVNLNFDEVVDILNQY